MGRQGFRRIFRIMLFVDEVTAIPRLIVFGGTIVTTALTHISSAIRSLPLVYEILLGIGILLLWLAGVLTFVRWLRRRKQPAKGTAIQSSIPDYTLKYADWMTAAIQDDVGDLSGCIIVNEPHVSWEHLEEREDAYIEFNFDIWSSSVHLLEISKQVEGNICLRGCGEVEYIPLKDTPNIIQKASQLSHLRRSRSAQLTIKQWLSFTVKGRMQTHYRRSQVEFDFSDVNISVVATLPDGSPSTACRLPIPAIVHAQVPDHPNPNAPISDTEGSQTE